MPRVIVVGGGYGGLRAIEHLAFHHDFDITLIDLNTFHYMQTEAYGYIAGRFNLHDVAIDLANWCHGFKNRVRFVHDEVLHANFDAIQSIPPRARLPLISATSVSN